MRRWLLESWRGGASTPDELVRSSLEVAAAWQVTSDEEWLELAGSRTSWGIDDLQRIQTVPPAVRQALLACASLSRSGRTREAVVRLAGDWSDPAALRWLLSRLVDWVPEVRIAALAVAVQLFERLDAGRRFELCRRHARWLLSQERAEVTTFVRVLADSLSTECRELVRAFVLSQASGCGPIVRLLLALEDPDLSLLAAFVRAQDRSVRQLVASRLARRAVELDGATVDFLLGSAGPEACSRFLAGLTSTEAVRYEPQLRAACGSRQRRVRMQAHWHLARLGVDLPAFVSQQLASASANEVSGWLQALGECGDRSRRGEIEAWLAAPDRRHRRAALMALQRLVGDAMWDLAADWMEADDEAAARTAMRMLRRTRRSSWLDAVRRLTQSTEVAVRERAYDLLTSDVGKLGWQVVPDLLAALLAGHRPSVTWRRFGEALGNQKARCWAVTDPSTRRALKQVWQQWRAAPLVPPPEFELRFAAFERSIAAQVAIA